MTLDIDKLPKDVKDWGKWLSNIPHASKRDDGKRREDAFASRKKKNVNKTTKKKSKKAMNVVLIIFTRQHYCKILI